MIKCPNCTGEMNYDVTSSAVKCPYCGSVFNPNELKTEVIRTDSDFYFLRDNLLKLYPATVVRLILFLIFKI